MTEKNWGPDDYRPRLTKQNREKWSPVAEAKGVSLQQLVNLILQTIDPKKIKITIDSSIDVAVKLPGGKVVMKPKRVRSSNTWSVFG